MKSEKILLDLINNGKLDLQILFTMIQEILELDDETMKNKIDTLRQKFIDKYRKNKNVVGWF